MRTRSSLALILASISSIILATACGGGAGNTKADSAASPPSAEPSAASGSSGPKTPDAGGKIITVEMTTDDQGNNKFTPNDFTASKGDVIRYTLVQGVHNVHFLPDSNPGAQGLPPASAMLQAPGQSEDVKVTWAPGRYFYQCDPHALLGMQGHVTVK